MTSARPVRKGKPAGRALDANARCLDKDCDWVPELSGSDNAVWRSSNRHTDKTGHATVTTWSPHE